MDTLHSLVHALSTQETRRAKRLLLASDQGEAEERKDILLFDRLRQAEDPEAEERIRKRLYPDTPSGRNAYYRLKNRLQERLLQILVWLQAGQQPENEVMLWLISARVLARRKHPRTARQLLQKAERMARKAEAYDVLDQVYSELLALAERLPDLDPAPYMAARRQNLQQLDRLRQADELLSLLNYRLRRSQTYGSEDLSVLELLRNTVDDWRQQVDDPSALSPKLRFKVLDLMTTHLLQQHDYEALAAYCQQTLQELSERGLWSKNTHSYQLRLLTYLVNSHFLMGNYTQSLEWAQHLGEAMEAYNRLHYDRYAIFYYNALLINYYVLDIDRAIALLQEMQRNQALKNQPIYEVFLLYNYAICWFKKRDYSRAIQEMIRLRIHKDYTQLQAELRLKIAMAELAIRYDRQEPEVLVQRLEQTQREFSEQLAQAEREQAFLELMKLMTEQAPHGGTLPKDVRQQVETFITERPDSETDVIDYAAWLKSKLPPTH